MNSVQTSYKLAMANRDWYFTRVYPWRVRIRRHPLYTIRFALADRFWQIVIWMKRTPLLNMRTFWGSRLLAPFPDYRSLLHHGLLDARELPVEDYIVSHLTEHDVFFDIGANIGFYSALAKALGAQVHAFEPTPRTYSILSRNIDGITLVNKALLDHEGSVSFVDLGVESAGSNSVAKDGKGNITVLATTLDSYCQTEQVYPTWIKMDIEKAERLALQGAQDVLRLHRPVLLIETNDSEVISLLLSLGYEAYHFDHAASGALLSYHPGEKILSANMLFLSKEKAVPSL